MTSVGDALRTAGVERLDGQLLLLHAMGVPPNELAVRRAWLLAHGEAEVPGETLAQFRQFAQRRADGEPLAYITRHKEFLASTSVSMPGCWYRARTPSCWFSGRSTCFMGQRRHRMHPHQRCWTLAPAAVPWRWRFGIPARMCL